MVPARLTASLDMGLGHFLAEITRLISAQFLHAGFFHIAGNMLYLWILGNSLGEAFGRVKFLLFYLTCGVLASLAQWWFEPLSDIPSLGASGAISGVMGPTFSLSPGSYFNLGACVLILLFHPAYSRNSVFGCLVFTAGSLRHRKS